MIQEKTIVKLLHHVSSDLYNGRPGTLRAEFTIRPFGNKYMSHVTVTGQNSKPGTKEVNFNGNSLWSGESMDFDDLVAMIEGFTGFDEVKARFDA